MNIYCKHVADKAGTLNILFRQVSTPLSLWLLVAFIGSTVSSYSRGMEGKDKGTFWDFMLFVLLLVLLKELYKCKRLRGDLERAIIQKNGVLENFFKADEKCFELGTVDSMSWGAPWTGMTSWSESSSAFTLRYGDRAISVSKTQLLDKNAANELQAFLKANYLAKAR